MVDLGERFFRDPKVFLSPDYKEEQPVEYADGWPLRRRSDGEARESGGASNSRLASTAAARQLM